MRAKITILETSLNTQDFSFLKSPTQNTKCAQTQTQYIAFGPTVSLQLCLHCWMTFLYSTLVISPLSMSVFASQNSLLLLSASLFGTFHLFVIILMSVYPLVCLSALCAWSSSGLEWHLVCPFICKLLALAPLPSSSLRPCFFHIAYVCLCLDILYIVACTTVTR
jgi:hypothetical protein